MFGVLSSIAVPQQGGLYKTYEDLVGDLNGRMEKEGYKIVKARSHRGRQGYGPDNGGPARVDLVCDRGGRPYKCMATKHKTHTKKTDCPWKAKAVYRKAMQGYVLTINCDQHNHEPGTPEPPTPSEGSVDGEEETHHEEQDEDDGPRPDAETAAAMQVAGVSNAVLRLTGDTFQQFKTEYRKISQAERLGVLSNLQLRIAAIYAIQNEEVQREQRAEAQRKRHADIEQSKRDRLEQEPRSKRRKQNTGQQELSHGDSESQQQETPTATQRQQPHQSQHGSAASQASTLVYHSTEMIFPVPGFDAPDQFAPFSESTARSRT